MCWACCQWHWRRWKVFVSEKMLLASPFLGDIALWSCEGAIQLLWSCEGVIFKTGLGSVCCLLLCMGLLAGCDGIVSIGVLKVTCLFLLLWAVRKSSNVASFGTLNLSIQNQSHFAYESMNDRLVTPFKKVDLGWVGYWLGWLRSTLRRDPGVVWGL